MRSTIGIICIPTTPATRPWRMPSTSPSWVSSSGGRSNFGAQIPADELAHRLVPGDGIARFEYPVVLIRKHQQLTGYRVVLKGFKQIQGLTDRATVVALAVDDQHRTAPIGDLADRRVAVKTLTVRIGVLSAHLQIPPPRMVRRAGELGHGGDTGVRDQAFEARRLGSD